jgi:peptidoglycan hydrolase-like protein with peptidoglycan-binding domain
MNPNYNGIIEDPRSEEQKTKDYKTSDLAQGEIVLNWQEYNEKHLKAYIIQNQDGSSSCVAQATAKLLAIHEVKEGKEYTQLCPKFIYTRRENYPDGGMYLPNALSIACKNGSCPECDMPCDDKGESFMNNKIEDLKCVIDAEKYKGKAYFQIVGGIDEVAKIIEQGYGVLIGCRFDYDEWTDVPVLHADSKLSCGHGIAVVDYVLYDCKKALIIEDSWGPHYGKGGRRIMTEEFFNARVFYAGYVTSLEDVKFIFTKTLKYGIPKCLDVKMLQTKLKIKADGIFGLLTKKAVIQFQESHDLKGDGIVGPLTNKELNK